LKDCQFVRRFFSRDYRRAVSARGECKLPCVIERTAIDACANWNSVDDFSAFGIEHDHHFVMATRKQTMMRSIESDSTWSFTRCKRPVRDDFMLVHIDYRDFALVFDVAVNAPRCFIYDREFWISSERNRRRDGS
jgi:hypothetical protein